MQKTTISIGIPAYNEGANIAALLKNVLNQKQVDIAQIIVSSDGSTDGTVKNAQSTNDRRIQVIANRDRQGIARGLNQINAKATGDVLVTLDADISVSDPLFLQKLVNPIISGRADLTSPAITELPPSNFYGQMLYVSMLLKNVLFKTFKGGNNIYTCHGQARAYSEKFYKQLNFPVSIGNDMYSYLFCIFKKFKYVFVPGAVAWYQLSANYSDHRKQSTRFFISAEEQNRYFPSGFVTPQTRIPFSVFILAGIKALPVLARYPFHAFSYLFLQLYLYFQSRRGPRVQAWDIAASSK